MGRLSGWGRVQGGGGREPSSDSRTAVALVRRLGEHPSRLVVTGVLLGFEKFQVAEYAAGLVSQNRDVDAGRPGPEVEPEGRAPNVE